MRVREILRLLDIKALFTGKVLPDIWKKVPLPLHKIPKDKEKSDYGLWMEDQISLKLQGYPGCEECEKVVSIMKAIGEWQRDVELQTSDGIVSGHPDFYRDDIIIEVKTTEYWPKMRHETIAQICAYSVLSGIKKVGLCLPLSETVIFYEISTDLSRFLDLLRNAVYLYTALPLMYLGIGSHYYKEDVLNMAKEINEGESIQVFIGSPRSASVTLSDFEIASLLNVSFNRSLYVHAPYVLLPSNSDDWMRKHLRTYIDYSNKINAKGLVVHIGSGNISNLTETFTFVDDLITEKCPLMIETSCGEGKEILANPEDLLDFYLTLNQKKYKICLDLCHVYCAGYDPFKVLDLFLTASPGSIGLIHFNNSVYPFSSKRDHHATIGFISSETMFSVRNLAMECNIDLVRE